MGRSLFARLSGRRRARSLAGQHGTLPPHMMSLKLKLPLPGTHTPGTSGSSEASTTERLRGASESTDLSTADLGPPASAIRKPDDAEAASPSAEGEAAAARAATGGPEEDANMRWGVDGLEAPDTAVGIISKDLTRCGVAVEPEPEPEELSAQQPSAADDLARLTGLPRPEAALLLEAASGDFSTAMLWHSEGRSVRQQDSTTDEYQLVVPDGVEPGQKLSTTTPTGKTVTITVPEGAAPGTILKFVA
mmetsp:Transcript_26204/g.59471  ORF Transcript_26204/g.59471 Transcript_26204/m.59471 type:complete len:248 (-) Transcript_26204:520-1263(-)